MVLAGRLILSDLLYFDDPIRLYPYTGAITVAKVPSQYSRPWRWRVRANAG